MPLRVASHSHMEATRRGFFIERERGEGGSIASAACHAAWRARRTTDRPTLLSSSRATLRLSASFAIPDHFLHPAAPTAAASNIHWADGGGDGVSETVMCGQVEIDHRLSAQPL